MKPPLPASPRTRATARLTLLAVCVLASTAQARIYGTHAGGVCSLTDGAGVSINANCGAGITQATCSSDGTCYLRTAGSDGGAGEAPRAVSPPVNAATGLRSDAAATPATATADITKGWNGTAGTETAEAYFSRKRAAARQLLQQNPAWARQLEKALNANNQTDVKAVLTRLGFDPSEINKAPVQVQFKKPGDATSFTVPTPAGLLTIAMRGNNPVSPGF